MEESSIWAMSEYRMGCSIYQWVYQFDLLMTELGVVEDERKILFLQTLGGSVIRSVILDEFQSPFPIDYQFWEVIMRVIEVLDPQIEEIWREIFDHNDDESDEEGHVPYVAPEPEEYPIHLTISSESALKDNKLPTSIYFYRMLVKADTKPSFQKEIRISGVVESLGNHKWFLRIELEVNDERNMVINGSFDDEGRPSRANSNRNPTPKEILEQVAMCAVSACWDDNFYSKDWMLQISHEDAQPDEEIDGGKFKAWLFEFHGRDRKIMCMTTLEDFWYMAEFTIVGSAE